jgi:hypothetical protein
LTEKTQPKLILTSQKKKKGERERESMLPMACGYQVNSVVLGKLKPMK